MATGVKPRDEEPQLTRADLDAIQDAMKSKQFRELLAEYCEEVRDPANQALYQKEMTQLEKERGYDVTFINPKGGYVIKTSVAGDRKAFINICSNNNIAKPSCNVQEVNGKRGMNWQIPYSIIPPREDYDQKRERCVIYDVVFHPDTMRMAEVNKQFRELVNKTALDGLQNTYNIHFDLNNLRFPKSYYKGMTTPAVIRKEDPDYKAPDEDETSQMDGDLLEKLYPQHTYNEKDKSASTELKQNEPKQQRRKTKKDKDFSHLSDSGYTIPKYTIKQQKNVDFQDYTYAKDSKEYSAIPSHIVVEVHLPLLSSTNDCTLDVLEKSLHLKCEKPAKYRLDITLPYPVNDKFGNAKFDKSHRKLIVTLPVVRKSSYSDHSLKTDSGVEMEDNASSLSEEETQDNLVVELSSTEVIESVIVEKEVEPKDEFLDSTLGYSLPTYTHNILDNTIAFTFHVKNTDPDSMMVKKDGHKVYIKFTSVGAGFVPVHYAAILVFNENVKFDNVDGEAWDNNVILQLELAGQAPEKFQIGLNAIDLKTENFDLSQGNATSKITEDTKSAINEETAPVVEVTNLGTETNIVVSSNNNELDEDDDAVFTPIEKDEKEIVWTSNGNAETGAKSILRKPHQSSSESSVDVASSMDYISSDCIHEESSLKKTVRFSDVIAKQFYRYNSSIEGQKKKNQRKKTKKRNQEHRRSESEAEDEAFNSPKQSTPRPKSAMKQRRDSGLADTSDAENDFKNTPDTSFLDNIDVKSDKSEDTKSVLNIIDNNQHSEKNLEPAIWETDAKVSKLNQESVTTENIKHNTQLYNPGRLNKGQYLEIAFKNDLIFDLDM